VSGSNDYDDDTMTLYGLVDGHTASNPTKTTTKMAKTWKMSILEQINDGQYNGDNGNENSNAVMTYLCVVCVQWSTGSCIE
jgi:hypothetical protein